MPPVSRERDNSFTVEEARRGICKRGDLVVDKVVANTTRGLFIGISKAGFAWIYWSNADCDKLSTNSNNFKEKCREFDSLERQPTQKSVQPKFHTFETLQAGKGTRGEMVQVNTTRGIYVGTTERGAIWISWNSKDLRCPNYLEMCQRFDERMNKHQSTIRSGNSTRHKETRTA
ncbi:MAG: hypothetical protein WCH39_22625 [Schlesneria sp.]